MPPKPLAQPPRPAQSSSGFDPKKYVNKHMPEENVVRLKQVFDIFDYDHSGQISIPQILDTIKALGLQSQAKNIIAIVQSSTTADELDFQTFIQIFGVNQNQTQASLQQLYEVFDPNGTNCFGPEQFQKVCDLVGERITPQQVDQIIAYADKDKDGGINFEEFVATVTRKYPKV